MISASDFFKHIYEGDENALIAQMGAKIAKQEPVKFGGRTPVTNSPQIKDAKAMTDDKNTKGFTKDNDPARAPNRPGHIDYPQTGYRPSATPRTRGF